MKSVAHILHEKAEKAVHTISPQDTVLSALKLLAEKRIGALVVTEGDRIVGIFSERDYARKVVLQGRSANDTSVREVMSSPVMYVRPAQTNEECMALMTQNRLRHLPVVDNEKLVGLVSIGDLVKDIISEQQFIIEQLEHYIRGERA